jgi:hypothetical protein
MGASIIVAICATVIAVVSLAASVYQARRRGSTTAFRYVRFWSCGLACPRDERQVCSSSTPASGRRSSPEPS